MLEVLVHQAGVAALAAETGYAESLDVDAYINGEDVDDMVAAQSVFDDWYPAPLEENLGLVEWMRAYNAGAPPGRALHFYGIDLTGGGADTPTRDAAMAENLRAVLQQEGTRGGRMLLFAHNWHIKKRASVTEAFPEQFPGEPGTTMGQYLQSTLGDQLVVVGSTFHRTADGTITG